MGDIPLGGVQPSPHASVSLMSIVAGASAPQVIHPEVVASPNPTLATLTLPPSRPSPLSSSSTPVVSASTSPVLSPLRSSSSQSIEMSPFSDWPSPPSKAPVSRMPSLSESSDDKVSLLSHNATFSPIRRSEDFPSAPNHAILHSQTTSPSHTDLQLPPVTPIRPFVTDPLPGHRVLPGLTSHPTVASLTHSGQLIPTPRLDKESNFADFGKGKPTTSNSHIPINSVSNNATINNNNNASISDPLPVNPFLSISPFGQPDLPFPSPSTIPSPSSHTPVTPTSMSIFPTPTSHPLFPHPPSSPSSIFPSSSIPILPPSPSNKASSPVILPPSPSINPSSPSIPPSSNPFDIPLQSSSPIRTRASPSLERSVVPNSFGDDKSGRPVFPGR